jgi:hypothetical protein
VGGGERLPDESENVVQFEVGGVVVEVTSEANAASFCVTAASPTKISAMYGLTFDSADRGQRETSLPQTFYSDVWDFVLPVEVELKAHDVHSWRELTLKLGACSDHCEIDEFQLRVPPFRQKANSDSLCKRR